MLADDFGEIYQMILDADGIVLCSLVSIHGVTAQLKTLIYRMADAIQCQMLKGVYSCGGGSGSPLAGTRRQQRSESPR